MRKILPFVIQFILLSSAFGQDADFNKAANDYLSSLQNSATAALYTACKTQAGKAVMVFSLDGKQGMLFEFKGDKVINSAPLILKSQKISIDVANTQGGIYTYTVMENHAKDLLNLPFKFVLSEAVKEVFTSMPKYVCVDKPPAQ